MYLKRSAVFDESKRYRYSLKIEWDNKKGKVVFIMLNPSIADENEDDPTTKRCIYFAKKFGYGLLEIVNLFAYISTDYNRLKDIEKHEAIGRENQKYIDLALKSADKIIAAWGENATIHKRHRDIDELFAGHDIDCLGSLTKTGHPRHPLYLSKNTELKPYKRKKQGVSKNRNAVETELCEECHINPQMDEIPLCKTCFASMMGKFKAFLQQEYSLSDSSAQDYVGRFRGLVKRNIYKWKTPITLTIKKIIEKKYSKSTNHYILTINRFNDFIAKY